jgi:transcriptional regulator PpsR
MAAGETFGDIASETTARIIAAAADIALVVDGNAVILDTTISRPDLKSDLADAARWTGQSWGAVVTEGSRAKVKMLIDGAASAEAPAKWRQLDHPAKTAGDIPILYCAIRIKKDRYLAIGRDIRAVAELQQRLVEAQTSMERDYALLRQSETRYRVLFHTTPEPVLIVDAASENVVEANPAAVRLFGGSAGHVSNRNLLRSLDADSAQSIKTLAARVRNGQNIDDLRVRLAGGQEELSVEVLPFRQAADLLFMLKFAHLGAGAAAPQLSPMSSRLLEFVRRSPDGFVVIDTYGRILWANPAFIQMTQLVSGEQAQGELIERWLGRSGVDVSVIIANLRHQEAVTLYASVLRGEYGASTDVEVSGFGLGGESQAGFGLAIRHVGRRLSDDGGTARPIPHTVEQLKELIGRVSLKDMVRESTDMIERLCIEAALDLTGDNRASAAEMLGLSRQSLYVKLRRYGMADDPAAAERNNS